MIITQRNYFQKNFSYICRIHQFRIIYTIVWTMPLTPDGNRANDSMTHLESSHFLSQIKSFLNESIDWMTQWLPHNSNPCVSFKNESQQLSE